MKFLRLLILLLATSLAALLAAQNHAHNHGSQTPASGGSSGDLEGSSSQMAERNLSESIHMKMTPLESPQAGDQEQAATVLTGARKAMDQYRDFRVAIADGYQIFLPRLPQKMYHFTNYQFAMEAMYTFNPEHPTSLLYEKHGNDYKLIGVMYTAPAHATTEQLNQRVPLSVAQWHAHVNFCQAPKGREKEYFGEHPLFGLLGSITTRDACTAQGGRFLPQVFGWMVHAYPDEKTTAQVWSVERQMEHGHGHMH